MGVLGAKVLGLVLVIPSQLDVSTHQYNVPFEKKQVPEISIKLLTMQEWQLLVFFSTVHVELFFYKRVSVFARSSPCPLSGGESV